MDLSLTTYIDTISHIPGEPRAAGPALLSVPERVAARQSAHGGGANQDRPEDRTHSAPSHRHL